LEVLIEELEGRRTLEENGEGIFVEMSKFLLEIERECCFWKGKMRAGEGGCFGEIVDEERSFKKGAEEGVIDRGGCHWFKEYRHLILS
jgi:hypothetical protein